MNRLIVRREESQDIAAIRFVNEQAFGGSIEANAIAALRDRGAAALSLDEACLILALQPGALDGVSGVAKYQPEWNGV